MLKVQMSWLSISKCRNIILQTKWLYYEATRQIKLCFFPSEAVSLIWNMIASLVHKPQCWLRWQAVDRELTGPAKLTFSTFSTVKSRASGVAAILPGVSITPLTRCCQIIKGATQLANVKRRFLKKFKKCCFPIIYTVVIGMYKLARRYHTFRFNDNTRS